MRQDPKHIRISEFNYPLPDERIAKFPRPYATSPNYWFTATDR